MRFAGTRCLVTGGASGIGRAAARAFAAEGARVAVLDLAASPDEHALALVGDVSAEADVARAFAAVDETLGGLDTVLHVAGIGMEGLLEEVEPADFDRAVAVNLRGSYLVARAALPRLRRAGGGSITLMGSNAGLVARHFDPVYCATKAAVVMLARSLALAHARDRIRVNVLCPGPVDTPTLWRDVPTGGEREATTAMLEPVPLGRALGRVASAEEVAAAALWLASADASYITGAALPVDGGKTAGLQTGVQP
jgi:NAD(P)-dependent dehydrogenase (short-subunit alcohol dehydrogenase family)